MKVNPTDVRVLKLESSLAAQRAENGYLTKQVKELRKRAAIFEALSEELGNYVAPLEPLPGVFKPKPEAVTEHLVMHLSDMHADQIVKPSQVAGFEDYDFKIACLRAEHYITKTLHMTQENLKGYHFPTLWVLNYGDQTSGEIHGSVSRSEYKNQFKNCLAIGRLQALMLRDLAPFFKEVRVICLPGNHGRRSVKKDYNGAHDNWDYLVYETASLLCEGIENVQFTIPDCFSFNVLINGSIFNVSHGDDIKSWNSIPYYGIERKTRRVASLHGSRRENVRYFVMGHFHQRAQLAGQMDSETLINGPWLGTDPYVYEGIGAATEPSQWIHGVHEKYGITWRMPVYLRTQDERKRLKDRRYVITL